MKTIHLLLAGALMMSAARAEDGAPELAARMNALQQDGTSLIRLKMDLPQGTLQVQIKQRRTAGTTEAVYQVLWPKERAGEAVMLKKSGKQGPTGAMLTPPDTVRTLDAGQMKGGVFGSDLAYADVVENFFAWEHQAIVGTENVGRTSCEILESKPGKGDRSIYSSVKTWVDTKRLVPMKVEKYSAGGQLARRIDTTRVVTQDGRAMPANLTVHDVLKGTATELDGSNIKRGVAFDEREFTTEGLKMTAPQRGKSE